MKLIILYLFAQLQFSVIYGQHIWKVYKNHMDPYHMSLRNYSRGATSIVCLEWHYPGVDILCFQMAFLEKSSYLKNDKSMSKSVQL
jgi:hypothetical protein